MGKSFFCNAYGKSSPIEKPVKKNEGHENLLDFFKTASNEEEFSCRLPIGLNKEYNNRKISKA